MLIPQIAQYVTNGISSTRPIGDKKTLKKTKLRVDLLLCKNRAQLSPLPLRGGKPFISLNWVCIAWRQACPDKWLGLKMSDELALPKSPLLSSVLSFSSTNTSLQLLASTSFSQVVGAPWLMLATYWFVTLAVRLGSWPSFVSSAWSSFLSWLMKAGLYIMIWVVMEQGNLLQHQLVVSLAQ